MLLSTPKNTLFHFFSNLSFFVSGRPIWHLICLDFLPSTYDMLEASL